MSLVLMFGFSIVVSLLVILLIIRRPKRTKKYLENVPVPKTTFLFGNALDFMKNQEYLSVLKKYLDDYGDTVVIRIGPFSKLLITVDYEFSEFLYSSTVEINKSDQYKIMYDWIGKGLLTSAGYQWRAHRKVITPSFHFSILQDFVEIFEQVGNRLVDKLMGTEGQKSVEVFNIVSQYALDVISEAAMGVKLNALEDDTSIYVKNAKDLCKILIKKAFSPINEKLYPLTFMHYKEQKHLDVIHRYVENVIQQRIQEREAKLIVSDETKSNTGKRKRLAFLDLLLEARIDGEPLSLRELRDEVNTFMFEGHDTTATTISFCLYLLAKHPSVQEKVLEEQYALLGDDLKGVKATYANLNEMKYLEMVIKETLRLYPPIPFVGRKLTNDVEFNGTIYPKDMNILLFTYYVHRQAKYFQDPEKFNPERFAYSERKIPFAYIPFAAGSRNCIGQKFAMLEITSALSKIVRNFELIPAIPKHDLEITTELVLVSKNGMRIALKKRF
ncbi:hypothetical protein GWI33_007034 [Rhynchophorus ferrugineus]|uniref:Cytochrome P450 n=1 Tax=Rhynchophorus ferrugineus TaxID=354439 RepID=A0A834IE32_RHYFE|nr:hypothetical protein GWI33_007034 [Rhynchophorus ferrugineus]